MAHWRPVSGVRVLPDFLLLPLLHSLSTEFTFLHKVHKGAAERCKRVVPSMDLKFLTNLSNRAWRLEELFVTQHENPSRGCPTRGCCLQGRLSRTVIGDGWTDCGLLTGEQVRSEERRVGKECRSRWS